VSVTVWRCACIVESPECECTVHVHQPLRCGAGAGAGAAAQTRASTGQGPRQLCTSTDLLPSAPSHARLPMSPLLLGRAGWRLRPQSLSQIFIFQRFSRCRRGLH
jgi:hypothetical protein